jgi:hypothetical protein
VLNTDDLSVQDAWQRASDANADLDLDYNSLNPHYSFIDEDKHIRHVVWFLDAVTLLDEMRGARALGLQTFALWSLGEEDRSLWNVWDKPSSSRSLDRAECVPPGHDLDDEGSGDIIRITGTPKPGKRIVELDTDETDPRRKLIIDEHMDSYPLSYQVEHYGYHPGEVALSFDDGPDPTWTPKILDILKKKNVKGTFMEIGSEAQENVGLMQRVVREGHEIGNHTYTHPDISEISPRQLQLELNLTERLFASKLGIQPLYFRPPYDIDQEPGYGRPGGAGVSHPADGLHHRRRQHRYRRLERASAQNAAGDHQFRDGAAGEHEDPAAVSGQHHSDARRRRQSRADGGRAAVADRYAAGQWLHHRAGLGADGQDDCRSDAEDYSAAVLAARADSVAFSIFRFWATSS